MEERYINKYFIVIIRRKSNSEPFTYFFKFVDSEHTNKNNSIPSKWKDSIISILFQTETFEEDQSLSENNIDSFAIRIVIHSAKDLLVGQSYHAAEVPTFAQSFLQEGKKNEKVSAHEDGEIKRNSIIPIIHVSLTNLYVDNMYGDNVELPSLVPRSYQIMDSSIWNYLVPINGIPPTTKHSEETGKERFNSAIDSIYNNYKKKLYSLSVSHEYADLNSRLAIQSYLSGAHASGVAPFIFHSESAIKRMIEDEFFENKYVDKKSGEEVIEGRNTIESIRKKKWRILLIDDKAISPMETKEEAYKNNNEFSWNCKLTIIRDILEKRFNIRGKIHCRSCKEETIDQTLSFGLEDNNSSIILKTLEEGIKERKKIIVYNKINKLNLDSEEFSKCVAKENDEILFEVLPIGNPIEGYKFYFNQKAVDCGLRESTLEYLKLCLKSNAEIKTGCPPRTQIVIEYAQSIEDAESALKNKKYDIILLDYLLNGTNGKEYGYKLLDDIYDALKGYKDNYSLNKEGYKIGPSERFFFIFISAYSSAVYERLLAEGLNRSEKYWHIAVGACPTNTPQLFLYNLIKLMEKRLDDSGIERLSAKGIYDIVHKIYGNINEGSDVKYVRNRANKYYQRILDLHYLYKKMLSDVQISSGEKDSVFNTNGSVLMTDFIIQNVNLGGLLEHLTQLVHLTAFGTIRQWPEMWEEYIYFKAQFDVQQFENECKSARDKFNKLCEDIESYILNLKSDIE